MEPRDEKHASTRHLTLVKNETKDKNRNISPIIDQIKDDGPALLKGDESSKKAASTPKAKPMATIIDHPRKLTARPTAKLPIITSTHRIQNTLWQVVHKDRTLLKIAICTALLLTSSLIGTAGYIYQQNLRIIDLEQELLFMSATQQVQSSNISTVIR